MPHSPTIDPQLRATLIQRVRAYMNETGYHAEEAERALQVPRQTIRDLTIKPSFGARRAARLQDALDHGFNRTAPFCEQSARNALDAWLEQRRKRTGETG